MKLRFGRARFECSWPLLAIYLVVLTLLCSLGSWQLARSDEKRAFLARQQAAIERDALDLNEDLPAVTDELPHRRIRVRGRFDGQHSFLIDNQILNGKPGYFVLTPLLIDGQPQAVMVNRGWVAAGTDRNHLPDVDISSQQATITGRFNHFPEVGYKLAGAEIPSEGWPSRVQVAQSDALAKVLGYPVYPFLVALDPEAAGGYLRQWHIDTPIPPEKHVAYAVQWYGLALALTGLFIWNSFKKHRG